MPDNLPARLVWARKGVALATCPKSYVTEDSESMMEAFFVQRRLGGIRLGELNARHVEAFLILERALKEENSAERPSTRG
jgi:hypothetical protein